MSRIMQVLALLRILNGMYADAYNAAFHVLIEDGELDVLDGWTKHAATIIQRTKDPETNRVPRPRHKVGLQAVT